jgi:hypothetical protein
MCPADGSQPAQVDAAQRAEQAGGRQRVHGAESFMAALIVDETCCTHADTAAAPVPPATTPAPSATTPVPPASCTYLQCRLYARDELTHMLPHSIRGHPHQLQQHTEHTHLRQGRQAGRQQAAEAGEQARGDPGGEQNPNQEQGGAAATSQLAGRQATLCTALHQGCHANSLTFSCTQIPKP